MAENIRHNADTASTGDDDRHGCQESIPVVGGASCGDDGFHLVSVISRPGELSTSVIPSDINVVVRFDASENASPHHQHLRGTDRSQSAPHI